MYNPEAPLSVQTGEVPEITEADDDISEKDMDDAAYFEQQNGRLLFIFLPVFCHYREKYYFSALNEHVQDIVCSDDDDPNDIYKPDGAIHLDIDCFSDFCRGPSEIQQRLSKPVFVRGLPWKILAIPRFVLQFFCHLYCEDVFYGYF